MRSRTYFGRLCRPSVVAAMTVVLTGLAFAILFLVAGGDTEERGSAVILVGTSAWVVVGALIVALRPENRMGWLFSAIGLLWTSGLAVTGWAEQADATAAPFALVSWYGEWFGIAALGLTLTSMLLFPSGHPLSRGWREATALTALTTLVAVVGSALQPEVRISASTPPVDNPLGVGFVGDLADSWVGGAFGVLFPLCAFVGVASIIVRYRRALVDDRLRIKWVALAAPIAVLGWIAAALLDSAGIRSDVFWTIPMLAIPVGAGIAILRHRLYDIDRLISRTIVYGSLTGVLAAAYAALVLVGQWMFSSVAGGSNLAIAMSTLLVAALFLPVRSRVQWVVDRRFYRRRYDAQRTLEVFGARLREQIGLTTLEHDLRGVVTETMQPAHVSVWLREARS